MEWKLEGTNTVFIRHIMGMQARRLPGGTGEMTRAEAVRDVAVMPSEMTYIIIWQANIAQWVVLQLIFKVCASKKV